MRAATLAGGLLIMAALAIPVIAQQTTASSMFTGVNPREIKSVPVDTSKAMKAMNINNAFKTPASPAKGIMNIGNIFPKISMPSWPPKLPSTPILSKQNNPFQPNPIVGKNPFDQVKK